MATKSFRPEADYLREMILHNMFCNFYRDHPDHPSNVALIEFFMSFETPAHLDAAIEKMYQDSQPPKSFLYRWFRKVMGIFKSK